MQLLHDGVLLLDGDYRRFKDVQETGFADTQGRGPQVKDQQVCSLYAETPPQDAPVTYRRIGFLG